MQTTQQGTVKDKFGQEVELGRPHQPTPGERKSQDKSTEIDMNPGEPARPYVGGEEPQEEREKR